MSEALFSLFFFLSEILLIVLFSESLSLSLVATLSLALVAPEFLLFICFILVWPGWLVLLPAPLSGTLAVEVGLEVGELTELAVHRLVGGHGVGVGLLAGRVGTSLGFSLLPSCGPKHWSLGVRGSG